MTCFYALAASLEVSIFARNKFPEFDPNPQEFVLSKYFCHVYNIDLVGFIVVLFAVV